MSPIPVIINKGVSRPEESMAGSKENRTPKTARNPSSLRNNVLSPAYVKADSFLDR